MDKKVIARNFSKCASFYDDYADVQRKSALEILGQMQGRSFDRVLEIGCGTGSYTCLLREKFRRARITAVDISGKMVEVAKGKMHDKDIEFIVADAEFASFPDANFDLITSNACFQWFDDLEAALEKYKRALKDCGLISFSMFGPLTFWELDVSLKSILDCACVSANNFINKDKVSRILARNFKCAEIKEMIYLESFGSILELLNKIKYTGARGDNANFHLGRGLIKKLEEAYIDKFKRVKVTYQVLFCQGRAG